MSDDVTIRGEIIGAEFFPEDGDGSYIVVRVAVPETYRVGRQDIWIVSSQEYERLATLDHDGGTTQVPPVGRRAE